MGMPASVLGDRSPMEQATPVFFRYRLLTSWLRLTPDFLIIGAQRCGTTSLYNYLTAHPRIAPAITKEVHYFDLFFARGIAWYRAHFPSIISMHRGALTPRQGLITGEASPYYIFHPLVPERVAGAIPRVKLLVLLRNPVDRAYSHYHHEVRMGVETLSFEDALRREAEELNDETGRIDPSQGGYSFSHQHYSYLARGIYSDQLEAWTRHFPKEQLLTLGTEDFNNDPAAILRRGLNFLELPYLAPEKFEKYNFGDNPKMDPSTRKRLVAYFRPHNKRLQELLGTKFGWDG